MNINRWGASLIYTYLTLKYCAGEREREREKESTMEDERLFLLLGFYTVLVEFYTEEVLRGFLPCGFPEENICVLLCSLVLLHLSFFQWSIAYGYDVMMLNVFRSCITIKNITWYQSHPERSLCAAERWLQLQPLEIRVSCLKTLEGKSIVILEFSL